MDEFKDVAFIEGVTVKGLPRYEDGRGWLSEFFRTDEIDAGLMPAMGYASMTLSGIGRGPHEHHDQTDIFFFPGMGEFALVLWDNRKYSKTFAARMVSIMKEGESHLAVVPPGVIHGYRCISKSSGLVINVPNRLYKGKEKLLPVDEIRHEDDDSFFARDFVSITEGLLK